MSNGSKKLKQEPRMARHCRSPMLREERKRNNKTIIIIIIIIIIICRLRRSRSVKHYTALIRFIYFTTPNQTQHRMRNDTFMKSELEPVWRKAVLVSLKYYQKNEWTES
jgi:hypothetical protein